MSHSKFALLFLGKADDDGCARALDFCRQRFDPVVHCLGRWGDPLPPEVRAWRGDYIISYLSRWVIPDALLARAARAAVNFHPAPPEYPGIGCTNFALYDEAPEYGVTCHHMAPQVDTGAIIAVRRFPLLSEDNIESLLKRTYEHQMALFLEISQLMSDGRDLPVSADRWTRAPYTRKEFNELFKVTPQMSAEEIGRRVRAVTYRSWRPYIEIQGYRFEYAPPHKDE